MGFLKSVKPIRRVRICSLGCLVFCVAFEVFLILLGRGLRELPVADPLTSQLPTFSFGDFILN